MSNFERIVNAKRNFLPFECFAGSVHGKRRIYDVLSNGDYAK